MKHFILYSLACVSIIFGSQLLTAYTVEFVDTGSSPACFNDPHDVSKNVVWIYYSRTPQDMDRYFGSIGKDPAFVQGLKESSAYFEKIAPTLTAVAGLVPEVGPALSAAVQPTVKIHKFLVSTVPSLIKDLFPGKMEADLRNEYDIERDKNVVKGNHGFRSIREINKKETRLYMTVVSKATKHLLMYNVPIDAQGTTYFTVKKDPKTGLCVGVLVNKGDPGHYKPTGPAMWDKEFLEDWKKYMEKDVLPALASRKDPSLPAVQKEVNEVKAVIPTLS